VELQACLNGEDSTHGIKSHVNVKKHTLNLRTLFCRGNTVTRQLPPLQFQFQADSSKPSLVKNAISVSEILHCFTFLFFSCVFYTISGLFLVLVRLLSHKIPFIHFWFIEFQPTTAWMQNCKIYKTSLKY